MYVVTHDKEVASAGFFDKTVAAAVQKEHFVEASGLI